jgi:hypothetical protein
VLAVSSNSSSISKTTRPDCKVLFTAAKRAVSLHFGKQLKMRSVGPHWSDEYEIYLDEDFEPECRRGRSRCLSESPPTIR